MSGFDDDKLANDFPNLIVVNCHECGELLASDKSSEKDIRLSGLRSPAGRLGKFWFCKTCLDQSHGTPAKRQAGPSENWDNENGGWASNALRHLEDQ